MPCRWRPLRGGNDRYRQALAIDPDRNYARFGLATILVPLGRRDEARTELDLLLAADPAHTPSRLLLARLLADEGQLAEAEEQLRKVVALVPDDVEAQRRWPSCRANFRARLEMQIRAS